MSINIKSPETKYQEVLVSHQQSLASLQKHKQLLGWLRFLCAVATITAAYYGFGSSVPIGSIALVFGVALFLMLVLKDNVNNKNISFCKALIDINEEELKILQHQFQHRPNGSQFAAPNHAYANDLDLFGTASLFQYLNRTYTEQGNTLLANSLLTAAKPSIIIKRQAAVNELTANIEFQQKLQAIGTENSLTIATQEKLHQWLSDDSYPLQENYWRFVLPAYICVTVGSIILNVLEIIPTYQLTAFLSVCLIFAFAQSRKVMSGYNQLSKMVKETAAMEAYFTAIETASFNNQYLKDIQSQLTANGQTASANIHSLKVILQRFDARLNIFLFIFLNTIFLWDVWQMRALNHWKQTNKSSINEWIGVVAELELLTSLAVTNFNNPTWVFPAINEGYFSFEGKDMGHPLLNPAKSVTNSFSTDGKGKIILITGSNMAGKSTFLRSIGCNTVLALMGSAVCATKFSLAPVRLLTSMRIADNLAESTSTFYAELKKLKYIIEAVNEKQEVLILLDEILRGTNSLDRHTGSKALIKQFIEQQTVAILATHDVALADEAQHYPNNIANYHFDVQVANDELFFDYKLKSGVCKSLNASILMRKIGIRMSSD